MPTTAPIIGITVNNQDNSAASGQYESAIDYSRAVAVAGGVPVLLPHEPQRVDDYVAMCDGFMLTGGADLATQPFGQPNDPRSRMMDPGRQAFETALLEAIDRRAPQPPPTLGVCLGMQLMALHAGGRLDPHLPDTPGADAAIHDDNHRHTVRMLHDDSVLAPPPPDTTVISRHHQAVRDTGRLRLIATAPDGTFEAMDDPARPFYLAVQWHPERARDDGPDAPLNWGLIARLVHACRAVPAQA